MNLTPEQIDALKQMGFEWRPNEKRYFQKYKHGSFLSYNDKLGVTGYVCQVDQDACQHILKLKELKLK